ncbi:hypothetical protein PR202_ga11061 [Eleusine coracana subsp. coracana]|uniref:Uncharacterized protein n=1 Tax=Eleusine coracana subsp. coracana TaxID=191504 RepID=A0AAV5C8E5_ELECO|nr:hypothetical protein PR202_ga11061 [Eleusine coracana subsp. coracana]
MMAMKNMNEPPPPASPTAKKVVTAKASEREEHERREGDDGVGEDVGDLANLGDPTSLRREMVVLHVKSTARASSPSPRESERETTEFLYECAASAAVADVAAALGPLAGLQARFLSLCRQLRERCADAGAAGELERALDEAEAYTSKAKRH